MATIHGMQTQTNLFKNVTADLQVALNVAAGTSAVLTYYNGYKPKTGTSTDYQLPNKAVGDIVFYVNVTTDTMAVTGSMDGTNFENKMNGTTATELVIFSESTGLPVPSPGNLSTGYYRIPYRYHMHYQVLQFTKTGVTAASSVIVAKVIMVP